MTDTAQEAQQGRAGDRLALPVAEVDAGALRFATSGDTERALGIGAFHVAVPEDLDVRPGLEFCRTFYQPRGDDPTDRHRGHREHGHPASKLGYEDRPDQVEQLQLESFLWQEYLPDEVTAVLRRMRQLTLEILYGVFDAVRVPETDRDLITGGARQDTGLCYTTVNHYRSGLSDRAGIVEHSDSGFITTICTDQPGYEILHEGRWLPVRERPGHFTVNLGDAFRVLTRKLPRPVTAVYHRVPELRPEAGVPDRSSCTVYMGPRYDMPLYQYDAEGNLREYQNFRDFSVKKAGKLGYDFHSRV
ncbi:2OG-Fe(II) oxygenase family protein [Streptomyces sp. DSM 44915]|uniref:2OG-Fe(II) oxygenase family protein n=1 Tax=Streptomyces chisholmiae TaxID=3075540 RepID=A0ABU2JR60_9ACTN|nr:2OG-Fe(II) oxygenase family protein [Streptomyces sp. DSM 44915]MDT0267464.1 2OG-Fe(II) oxygenase family protein [Streptomyces sp. DSM 44915]